MSVVSWNWWAVPGTLTLLVAWTAAAVVYRTAPERSANRRLATVLVLDGVFMGMVGPLFFFDSPAVVRGFAVAGSAAMAALPFQYLAFLGAALDTPLVAPFRSRRAFYALSAGSVLAAAGVLAFPDLVVTAPYQPGWAPWNFQFHQAGPFLAQLHGVGSIFGLVAAVAAFVMTPRGSAARSRAKWFAFAFGVRDIYVGVMQSSYASLRPIEFWGDFLYNPTQGFIYLVYVVLLTYGILRTQLFAIELKVKVAIQQSTLGAGVAGAFLVASEILESVLPVDGQLLGVISALAIVAALRPLQRFAEAFANRVMRGVEPTPAYLENRKLEVYRAALEGAMQDGVITEKEGAILASLRHQLKISEEDAERTEDELARKMMAPPPGLAI
jgi:hypothetical protein